MALQFNCELQPRSLVDLSYQSSDEDMNIDSVAWTDDTQNVVSDDDEIQVLACYNYNDTFPQQLVAGRAMTTELTECLNDLNIPPSEPIDSVSTFSEPSNSLLIDLWGILHLHTMANLLVTTLLPNAADWILSPNLRCLHHCLNNANLRQPARGRNTA